MAPRALSIAPAIPDSWLCGASKFGDAADDAASTVAPSCDGGASSVGDTVKEDSILAGMDESFKSLVDRLANESDDNKLDDILADGLLPSMIQLDESAAQRSGAGSAKEKIFLEA